MVRSLLIFITGFIAIFLTDQAIKSLFLDGFRLYGECISLVLAFNKGVAFSMFDFLGEDLKYIQLGIIIIAIVYILFDREVFQKFSILLGMLFGAGSSNLFDRFVQEGVVDYVYWHCGFDFAIFNFADVVIDIAVVLIIFLSFKENREKKLNESKK